jgi:hypothetical protein
MSAARKPKAPTSKAAKVPGTYKSFVTKYPALGRPTNTSPQPWRPPARSMPRRWP